jgi:hypothetical protein
MKKFLAVKCWFIIIFILISVIASAQCFKGGIMLGITGSQMDGDTYDGFNKFGLSGGVFAIRELNDLWGLQAELKFIMKGAAKPATNFDPTTYKMTLFYYELPVLVTLNAARKIRLESGLAFAYLFRANSNLGFGIQNVTSQFSNTDVSVLAGVYYILSEKLSANLKYSYSIKAVSHLVPFNMTIWGTYGQYNNVIDLSLYYFIK